MVGFLSTLVALATGASLVAAGPCGYGALCGRVACDGATVAAFQAALPQLNACGAEWVGYKDPYPAIESEATLRRLCLAGACGASFKTFVKFYDIESKVCELNYPTRVTELVSYGGPSFVTMCLSEYSDVTAYPALKAELAALIAEARGTAVSTTSPPVTTKPPAPVTTTKPPAPVTTTPEPTTASPTPPPTTTSPATPEPTTETPSPVPTTANATADGSRDESSSAIAEPQADADASVNTKNPTTVPSPTTPTPKASLAMSTRGGVASLLCIGTLAAMHAV